MKFSPKVKGKRGSDKASDDNKDRPNKGKGKAKFVPNDDETEPYKDDKPNRGKGKPSLAQTGDEEDDSHKKNQNKGRNKNQKKNGDTIDCDDYEDADRADTPKECQEDKKVEPKDTSTSSSSGKGNGKPDKPNRGKKN